MTKNLENVLLPNALPNPVELLGVRHDHRAVRAQVVDRLLALPLRVLLHPRPVVVGGWHARAHAEQVADVSFAVGVQLLRGILRLPELRLAETGAHSILHCQQSCVVAVDHGMHLLHARGLVVVDVAVVQDEALLHGRPEPNKDGAVAGTETVSRQSPVTQSFIGDSV
eukprot:CAMPEP_0205908820 /NCGR_PEP_ID=MMETSP1325-20131115/3471_1 /ASSEMBLY_ACC=CAM_ASM_000708 /TAXON_ID=236786 /ORGANISM="Florenciella sp., Strain RCC1007" /LENGTH=167 /DNA_ID=CAMNT_0053275061 /DNA_START=190 /DNA_END=694 /DNA_ORIENTATION=+